jgi:oxygen-dependent protoporphyrinogen oxidase
LLTSFLGGATDPGTAFLPSSSLVELVHRELQPILGLKGEPVLAHVMAYKCAIPQYNLGHAERIAAIQSMLQNIPGLHLTGNYFRGPSIGSCVEHAQSVAESIRMG